VIGWLLDTNVVSALINPNGAPSVKAWAAAQDEEDLYLSVLTLGEYDKGIFNLADDHPDRQRYIASRDALEARFAGRIQPVGNAVVRRWGRVSGTIKRKTAHPPPVIDTMLAATAVEHDLYLVTRNVRDTSRTGATVFDPWNDDPSRFPLGPRRKPRG
jgi:toxin FitB